jgi:mono/diheme cytochrome c family protein
LRPTPGYEVGVPTRTWYALLGLAALALAALVAWEAGILAPPRPPLVESPEAVAAGQDVFAYRCTPCHRDVPLAGRVAGWSAERAYQTIGRLQEHPRANMPRFPGTEEDRRVLAVFLAALGAGRARQP